MINMIKTLCTTVFFSANNYMPSLDRLRFHIFFLQEIGVLVLFNFTDFL